MKTLSLWLLVAIFGLAASSAYAGPDKDKDGERKAREAQAVERALAAAKGACTPGVTEVDLDVNNVRARLSPNGMLFYPSSIYEIPRGSGLVSIFASGIWVGGEVNGELRMAAATYAQFGADYEFFPGPINDDGTVPNPDDCSEFDRIWKVSLDDLDAFERGEDPTTDLLEWPFELGAPVIDGDGNPNNYNLQGGDRPQILGDQTLYYVINDAAGPHLTTLTPSIGLEVRVTAFAFRTADALNNTTFYKWEVEYKPTDNQPIENMYLGIWSDPDLGQYTDDYVGSDPTLGLGYVYNGDNFDEGGGGYQDRPPALGYDFFQGPLVNTDGEDNDGDGEIDEDDERLRMTRFVYYNNDGTDQGNPADADDFYGYLRGRWKDGSRITFGGDGFGDDLGLGPTDFMFPGNPPDFWSEGNIDGAGTANVPADRRFIMSTGPFSMQPGDVQEIVFGIVWSQTANRIGSVNKLKADDILAQGAFDFNFALPRPPASPNLEAAALDNTIILEWNYLPTDNNYLNSYDEESAFLIDPNVSNTTFTFEGYKVYQYASPSDFPDNGIEIATLDVANNVTSIVVNDIDPDTGAPIRRVAAAGTDSGVQNFLVVDRDFLTDQPLRNYTQYYYGVQAYAYNPFSEPPIYASPIAGDPQGGPITVVPRNQDVLEGGTVVNAAPNDVVDFEIGKLSDAIIQARISDPGAVTGENYEIRFYTFDPEGDDTDPFLTYDVVNTSTGETVVSGDDYYNNSGGRVLPFGNDVLLVDGLSLSITDAPAGIAGGGAGIVEVATEAGPLPASAYDGGGAPYGGNSVWHSLNAAGFQKRYYVTAGGGAGTIDRLERFVTFAAPRDFEMRFTDAGGYCVYAFEDDKIASVPFEIWDIGVGTPDDPSDDKRMIPFCLAEGDATPSNWNENFGASSAAGDVDPFFGFPIADWVYWMDPLPDSDGYEGFARVAEGSGGPGAIYNFELDATGSYYANFYGGFVYPIGRFAIGDFDGSGEPPPSGTVIRVNMTKPILPGDVFALNTADLSNTTQVVETLEEGLDNIGIVPNPYRGSSSYDVSTFQQEVRFTNMPETATVRIYTLSGTLIRTLEKTPGTDYLRWNIRTQDGLPIASGIYLVHVDVPGVGERILKFGVVSPKIQLNVF